MNPKEKEAQPIEEDLWGRICLDYHRKRNGTFVIRRDDEYTHKVETERYFRSHLPDFEVAALERAEGHVLDVGCGVGPDLQWLQEHGTPVTGIDVSAGAIRVAKARGCKDARVLSLWEMADLPGEYDTITMIDNNLGLPGSLEALGQFLDLCREVTRDNALLIGHSLDPTNTTNPQHLQYQHRNEAAGRYKGQVRLRLEYRDSVTPWWDLLLLELVVAQQLLADHGWETEDVLPAGQSYILVARKVPS